MPKQAIFGVVLQQQVTDLLALLIMRPTQLDFQPPAAFYNVSDVIEFYKVRQRLVAQVAVFCRGKANLGVTLSRIVRYDPNAFLRNIDTNLLQQPHNTIFKVSHEAI